MPYEATLAAALADRGLVLERTELADDATWAGCEQLVVYVRGERKPIADPVLQGDLDSRAYVQQIAERVAARVKQRHPAGAVLPQIPTPLEVG